MAAVQPSNTSELQLYRVLQRANLLQYFETFITQGGDDVQQLCEAGEDEFLEIMALVGMASKPLHVRRLQKALQEWVANPAAFEGAKKYPTHVMSMTGSSSQSVSPTHPLERSGNLQDYKVTPPQSSAISTSTTWSSQLGGARGVSPSEGSNLEDPSSSNSPPHEYKEVIKEDYKEAIKDSMYNHEDSSYSFANMPQPILQEHQITAIASAAAMLAQDLPPFEPKSMPKKQISKEISAVMLMSQDDPNRMDALRKYAAIYGRFDSKRKNDRPMSLHEISVNEAAAQLCHHFPALLTRREELFPLARQVVRDSGYQYSKGHSRAAEVLVSPQLEQDSLQTSPGSAGQQTSKADSFNELQNELTQITLELSEMNKEQDRIRSALRVLLEANDHEQMKGLTAEMDDLNDRHAALTKRRQRIVNIIARYRKGNSKYSVPAGTSSKSSSKHSPSNGQSAAKANNNNSKFNNNYGSFTDDTVPANPLNTLYMAAMHKDSLFEEGLRIAQQYGMSDFAQELIGLKKSSTNEGTEEKSDSGVNVSSESNSRSSAFTSYSSSSTSTPFVPSSVEAVSSSMYVAAGNGQCIQSTPLTLSSVSSGAGHGSVMISATKYSTSSTGAEKTKPMPMSKKQYHLQGHKHSTSNPSSSPSISESSHLSNDESMDISSVDNNNTMKSSNAFDRQDSTATTTSESTIAQGSTTTTTTITTKSGQVIEVETRRSSRRKNGEPDYYLINGGEKRFRSGNSRRSSSTSSERARRLSSSSSTSSVTPATPTSISPVKQPNKSDSPANGDNIIRMNVTELRFRNGADVQKVILDVNQMCDSEDHVDINSAGGNEDNSDMDKRAVRKKGRPPSYTGQKVLMSEDIH